MDPTIQDKIQAANTAFHLLTSSRWTDRYKAMDFLGSSASLIDLPTLKTLLSEAITKDYYVGKEQEQEDFEISSTRSWLLEVLARKSTGDAEATRLAMKHIDGKFEPNGWGRYWALEGLISGRSSEAELAARNAFADKDALVSMLAKANVLQELQSETQEELPPSLRYGDCRCLARRSRDALLPSVLDRAFKVEL